MVGKPIKTLPKEIRVSPDASAQEIYSRLAEASSFSVHRLRITKGSDSGLVPNAKDTTVSNVGLQDQSVIQVKDLGMWDVNALPSPSNALSNIAFFLLLCRPPDWMANRVHH